ncbi:MAG: hypothetical protein KDA93_12240, partial [Planctomycetaceae bacterium]|nr:hypothetical protein [Planctomycetaceae bacterium]
SENRGPLQIELLPCSETVAKSARQDHGENPKVLRVRNKKSVRRLPLALLTTFFTVKTMTASRAASRMDGMTACWKDSLTAGRSAGFPDRPPANQMTVSLSFQ